MKGKRLLFLMLMMPLMAWAENVTSPNGNIVLTFSLTDKGRPTYEMTYKGRPVIKPSHLGLELAKDKHASKGMNETDLIDGFKVADVKYAEFDETWKPVWGETATIRNHYNEMAVTLVQNKQDTEYQGGRRVSGNLCQTDASIFGARCSENSKFKVKRKDNTDNLDNIIQA